MATPRQFPRRIKPGDPLSAQWGNDLIDWIKRSQINLGTGSGLELIETPLGTALKATGQSSRFLAVANGAIPARGGAAAGIGSVYLVMVDSTFTSGVLTAVHLTTDTVAYDVYNPSSNTMTSGNGVDSGQYCWIEEFPSGLWCVSPLECS